MKNIGNIKKTLAVLSLLAIVALALPLAADQTKGSWTGWVTDPHCGAKGAKADHKECALKCIKGGDKLVFYNTADQKLYQLDNQDLAKEHLGHEVVVNGSLDGESITVESIAMAPEKKG